MFLDKPLLGGRSSAYTLLTDPGILMSSDGYIVSSESTSTSFGSLACSALGTIGDGQFFHIKHAGNVNVPCNLLLRVPWTLTTQCATAAARATMRARLYLNNNLVATGDGAPRNINAINGTKYTEIIGLYSSSPVVANPGDVVKILITPYITTIADPGQTFTPTLRHDPQTVNDQLVVEAGGL